MIIGIDASRATLAHRTGTEQYAYHLIQALGALASADFRLRLYTHQAPQGESWPDTPFVETRLIPLPRLWTHLRLAAEISRHPPHLLFVPAHVLPLFCPVPSVVTVHDLAYRFYPETYTASQRWYLDWSTRRHTQVADHLIADSAATRTDLVEQYQAKATQISVVHLGRDPNLQPVSNPQPVLAKYNLQPPYLLYIGTLQPRKNLERVLLAFSNIAANYPVHLVLAGSKGWLYDTIFARVEALGLGDRVHFPGYIAEADKAALISGATVYLYPSLYEGFGLPLLEAMACGTPILSSNLSSMPEIAGDAAWLVDPHNSEAIATGLRRLLTDTALRDRLTARGLERVQAFSWGQAAEQVLSILATVAERPR